MKTCTLENIIDEIKGREKTLFILCGFPYSGKSFLVKQILAQTNCELVSIDDIFYAHGYSWDTNKLPDIEAWQNIFSESYRKTSDALGAGKNVLYDSTNQTLSSRDELRRVATSAGAESVVLYIRTAVETVWQRWEENKKNKNRSVIDRELIQTTINMFETPTLSENVLVIDN